MTMTTYTRPEITKDDMKKAGEYAKKFIVKYGVGNFGKIIVSLCAENIRLTREVNEHREARGIEPLQIVNEV